MKKSAKVRKTHRVRKVHLGLAACLVILVVLGYFIKQYFPDFFLGANAAVNKDGSFSNLVADLKQDSATFYFSYSSSAPQGYIIEMSNSSNMKQNLYRNFATGLQSPIVENNPTKYNYYECGKTLYWRVVVGNTQKKSSVQSSSFSCPSSTYEGTADLLTNYINLSSTAVGQYLAYEYQYYSPDTLSLSNPNGANIAVRHTHWYDDQIIYDFYLAIYNQLNWTATNPFDATIKPIIITSGTHKVKACIDTQNQVNEPDETNNCKEVSFTTQ